MAGSPIRVYLTGTICLQHGETLVRGSDLPGRQGRLAFAMLAAERERPVTKDEIAEELWNGEPPDAWGVALRAIVSKLRRVLDGAGIEGSRTIASAFGCYQLLLPADAWVDLEAAADAVHRAETSLREGDLQDAMGWSLAANAIGRRGFLPGEDGPWASRRQIELRHTRVRALECRTRVLLSREDFEGAARDAALVVELEPFRETGYRLLMRAHAGSGNTAEALRTFERCRTTIAEELGVSPSAETESIYLEILRSA